MSAPDGPVRDLLRFATAGSVDDGKSTLVGRLLYDTKSVLADQIEAVHRASVDKGLSTPDLSLLVDGLRAEREQGITIDVAYRYFSTPRREFVLADTPGHVQYTRNTVTGASTAELAVLLVDARNGVVEQTRRHAAVLALLRVPRLVLAINKIDLVDYDEAVLAAIGKDFTGLTRSLGFAEDAVVTIPVSALVGDNVVEPSVRTPWYTGPTLLGHLESVPVTDPDVAAPFRMPVQYVIRPRTPELPDYRGYAGQVAAGSVAPGDEVVVLPGGARTTVTSVDTADGTLPRAATGRSITVLLADDIDISRGEMLAAADAAPPVSTELEATLCWLADKPLRPGARLLLKHGTRTTQVIVGALGERLDTQTVRFVDPPEQLAINDIARVALRTADPLPVDDYADIRATGCFLLIDPATGNTLAAGLVGMPLNLTGP
ncbi:MAG TPA: GTP-binding protein [Pseudonocardia sp.]|nr:GTP-binding protein [Pseudonocardia sp.]